MLIKEARAAAADWVRGSGATAAFVTGSSLDLADGDLLSPDSDVDVIVVADGPGAPAKIGKVEHHGARLDVSFIAAAELADADAVARTHYLAPSFAKDGVVLDDGRLEALRRRIAPTFAEPKMIMERVEDVVGRMDAGLAGVGRAGTWAEQLQGWIFPVSLPTQVLLVAGLHTPTVRLRYLRTRDLLADRGRLEIYDDLLDLLGCRAVTADLVHDHLAALDAAFTAAARHPASRLPFASDITAPMHDATVGATRRLVAAGDHREAVFWLMVTFLRCQLILEEAGDPAADHTEDALRRAADQLLDVRTADDLRRRSTRLGAWMPTLRAAAAWLTMKP